MSEQNQELLAQKDPIEVAATQYSLYLPRFDMLLNQMSKGDVKRVLRALIYTPLEDAPELITQASKECFAIAMALQDAKYMMIIEAYRAKLESELNQTEGEKPNE